MLLHGDRKILAAGDFGELDSHITNNVGGVFPKGGADSRFTNIGTRYAWL